MHAMAVIYHNVVMKEACEDTEAQATGITSSRNGIVMRWLMLFTHLCNRPSQYWVNVYIDRYKREQVEVTGG